MPSVWRKTGWFDVIAKPCLACGREDAGCGHGVFGLTECRKCGATVLGWTARDGCHKCEPSIDFEPVHLKEDRYERGGES